MSMEIKVGDKVRVSEKTPIEYNPRGEYAPLCVINGVVQCVVNDYAICEPIWDDGVMQTPFLIPTKYLVKVDGEYKPKFKKGDKVRFKKVYTVVSVDDGQVFIDSAGNHIDEDHLELYTEPTEQTEAEKTKTKGNTLTFPIVFDLTKGLEGCDSFVSIKEKIRKACADSFDWDAYTADLAREIAVKSMEKSYGCDPERIADYAVSVAKAVVEGLKRK